MNHQTALRRSFKTGPNAKNFVGRESVIHTLTGRIYSGDSSSIVGPPHVGKTCLLRHLREQCENNNNNNNESSDAALLCVLFFDCHMLPASYTPTDFFRQLWPRLHRHFPEGPHSSALHELLVQPTEPWAMSDLFTQFAASNRRVVLLLDEFDTLFQHNRFHQSEFFGPLRSLSSTTDGGLTLITASRLSVAEMNRRTQQQNPTGSPFFNNNVQVSLRPFTSDEVAQFLELVQLTPQEALFVSAAAGSHPFLLCEAVNAVHETRALGVSADIHAEALLRDRVAAHCADQWQHLSIDQQQALSALARNSELICRQPGFTIAVNQLCADGVVERENDGGFRISSGLFYNWVIEHSRATEIVPTRPGLSRAEVRLMIASILRADSSLDAFCMDYFPNTHQLFTAGMDRQQKVNLLLQCEDLEQIVNLLSPLNTKR